MANRQFATGRGSAATKPWPRSPRDWFINISYWHCKAYHMLITIYYIYIYICCYVSYIYIYIYIHINR